jgi:hypothetical protein
MLKYKNICLNIIIFMLNNKAESELKKKIMVLFFNQLRVEKKGLPQFDYPTFTIFCLRIMLTNVFGALIKYIKKM